MNLFHVCFHLLQFESVLKTVHISRLVEVADNISVGAYIDISNCDTRHDCGGCLSVWEMDRVDGVVGGSIECGAPTES